jgi:tetratricopeptide (TPR) repeat protein
MTDIGRPIAPWVALLGALCALAAAVSCGESDDPIGAIRELHANRRYAESLEPLRALLDENPDQPEVNLLLGEALMRTGDSSSAIWPLRRALESPDHVVEAGLLLGQAELASRTPRDVLNAVEPVLEVEPENVEALVIRAQGYLKANRHEEALADIVRVAEIDPGNLNVLVPRVLALIELERIDEAEQALLTAQEILATTDRELGESVRGRLCVANALFAFEKGDQERASELYAECLETYPADRLVITQTVAYFDRLEDPERATETLRQAFERTRDAYFRTALAKRMGRLGDREEQERLLREDAEDRSTPQAWFTLADFYVLQEEFDKGAATFEKALAAEAEPPPMTRFAYIDTLIQADRFDDARRELDTIEQEEMKDLLKGRLLLATGDPHGALRAFESGIRLWPNNAGARFLAGEAAEQIGDFDRAIEEYREALRRRGEQGSTDAALHLARILAGKGAPRAAFSAIHTFLRSYPANTEALLLAIHLADELSQPELVAQGMSRLVATGHAPMAMALQIAILAGRSGHQAAIDSADKSGLDLTDPENAVALGALLEQEAALTQHEKAKARIEAALDLHPDAAAFHELAARVLLAAGGPVEEARASYERALVLNSEHAGALAGLAELSASEGARDEAIALYGRASAADPDETDYERAVIELLQAAGRTEDAERRLTALVLRNPRDARAAFSLAKSLFERGGDPDRALSYAKRAAYFIEVAEAPELLGSIHLERGEHDAAVEVLSAAVESRPEATSARYQLGVALAAKGESARAREEFDAVIRAGGAETERARIEISRLDQKGSQQPPP